MGKKLINWNGEEWDINSPDLEDLIFAIKNESTVAVKTVCKIPGNFLVYNDTMMFEEEIIKNFLTSLESTET